MEEYVEQIKDIISFLDDAILYADSDEYDMKKAQKDKMALQTLLKRYKELEEENKKLNNMYRKEYDEHMEMKRQNEVLRNNERILKDNSIPISVIQNKKADYERYKGTVMYEKYNYEEIIQVLQELLEERKANEI